MNKKRKISILVLVYVICLILVLLIGPEFPSVYTVFGLLIDYAWIIAFFVGIVMFFRWHGGRKEK